VSAIDVRHAVVDDLEPINDLYNHYVVGSHVTFDIEPITMDQRREWFSHYGAAGRHHVLVAVAEGELAGYATSSVLWPKPAYVTSVATSVYVADGAVGRGVGTRLYAELFPLLAGVDVHRAYAGIAMPNPASVALHHRFGFKQVAYFTEQGRKFDRWWDVAWYEKPIGC
jgi:phosphinothricin acetyltransferase